MADIVGDTAMDPALALEQSVLARQQPLNELTARGDSDVQKFYDGAVVFITGGSGFIGKQFIEKLFRSCNISKVYMLLRTKKGKSAQERIDNFVKDTVFERLHGVKPDFVTKIFPIVGDVTKIGLGITQQDRNLITNEVTMIFHVAATVSFTEPIKLATLTNVRGTCEMLLIGKECKKLKAYVHMSTAYTHATNDRIKKPVLERFYDSPISPSALIELVETVDEKILDDMTPGFIKNWPNTYSFTKAVAEEAVRTMSEGLPICIVRPAVVICAHREPMPGWLDRSCVFGPSGYLLGFGLGALHSMHVDLRNCLDFVPVDHVNNATIVAAKEAAKKKPQDDIKIYTITFARNPINFGNIIDKVKYVDTVNSVRSDKQVLGIFSLVTKYKWLFLLLHFIFHHIPALIADLVLRMMGKRPIAVKLCNLLLTFSSVYQYYLNNDWVFGDKNLTELYFNLSPADRMIFECNSTNVYWQLYLHFWGLGLRKYVIKDGLNKSEIGRRKGILLHYATLFIVPLYLFTIFSILKWLLVIVFKIGTFVTAFI